MENHQKKLSKNKIRAIIVAAISCMVAIALIVTNYFIPVKYLASYMVSSKNSAEEGVMRVRFIDVGYGDCTVIELPDGKNMLIDGGDGSSKNTARILKFLNKSGIKTLDYLVCTSVNAEHCGGLAEIIQYKKVNRIFMPYCTNTFITKEYRNFVGAANSCGAEIKIAEYGNGEQNEEAEYYFTFLSPSVHTSPDGEYAGLNSNPTSVQAKNDASAVLWLEYAGTNFLIASDVTDKAINRLCDAYLLTTDFIVNLYDCDVIKVPNHGNSSSACARLYDLTNPQSAVISVGENGLGCPSLEAISNAVNYVGEKIYRTDENGTVTFEVTKYGYSLI